MKTLILLLFLFVSVNAQQLGDLRYTSKLEIYLDYFTRSQMFVALGDSVWRTTKEEHISGWFDFDSLYTFKQDGYVNLGNYTYLDLGTIQQERTRFKIFMEEYLKENQK